MPDGVSFGQNNDSPLEDYLPSKIGSFANYFMLMTRTETLLASDRSA